MPADEEFERPEEDLTDFVPAVFARSAEEAEQYRELLDDHDIPAIIGSDEDLGDHDDAEHRAARRRGMTHGVPILVPEVLLDEAGEVIAEREDLDEFQTDDEEEELQEEEDDDEEEDVEFEEELDEGLAEEEVEADEEFLEEDDEFLEEEDEEEGEEEGLDLAVEDEDEETGEKGKEGKEGKEGEPKDDEDLF